MWESLATSQRQDRALHGAAKLVSILFGLIALPIWLIGQRVAAPLRRMLLERGKPPELPVPYPAERSMDSMMRELEAIPGDLRPQRFAELRKGLPDLSSFVLAQTRQGLDLGYAYPAQFDDEWFEGADGERIAMSIARHELPRPGLVVVHGLFSSRRFEYVREVAVRAYFEWGFNVAAIDLRSFGATEFLSRAPSTGGWKEGEDIVCAGRFLKEAGSTSVGAIGTSLGAACVLGACHVDGAEEALDGGVLAVCPPADTRYMVKRMSRAPKPGRRYDPMTGVQRMLRSRVHASRWPAEFESFFDPIEKLAAPYYGVSADEIFERSSAKNTISGARAPVLILHSEDDWLIPVKQARMLADAAAGNDLVRAMIVPGGRHGAIDAIDPEWAWTVYRRFFERWAEYPDARQVGLPTAPGGETEIHG